MSSERICVSNLADVDRIGNQVNQVSSGMCHRLRKVGGQELEQLGPQRVLLGFEVGSGLRARKLEQLGSQNLVLKK